MAILRWAEKWLPRSCRIQILLIALVGLALRLALDAKLAPYPWPDSRDYLAAGTELLRFGRMVASDRMPLYPLVLASIGPHAIILVQALLSTLTAVTAYFLAREIFRSSIVASLAGLLAACDPVEIFYADQRLSETLFTFLLVLSLLLFYRRKYFAGSILFVLSLLVRPTFDLLGVPLVLLFVWQHNGFHSFKLVVGRVGIYVAIYIVLMSPWWWHNYEKYGTFVRLDLGDGYVMRLEQSPQFAKFGFNWPKLEPVFHEFQNVENPVHRHALLRQAALNYIQEHPLRYLKLCVFRFGRFWSPVIDQDDNFAPGKVRAAAFAVTLFIYLLCMITLASIRMPTLGKLSPLLVSIGYLMTVHTLLHALPRYRVPIEPFLCVLAAGAVLPLAIHWNLPLRDAPDSAKDHSLAAEPRG